MHSDSCRKRFAVRFRARHFQRAILAASCLLMFTVAGCADESEAPVRLISHAESFARDSGLSEGQQLPIVVFVSQHGCEFCAALRKQVLFPMIRSHSLEGKAILRELSLDAGFVVVDFDGSSVAGADFARRYAAVITPTLLFLDSSGAEIAAKLVGTGNLEFYGFYLEESLREATSLLAARRQDTLKSDLKRPVVRKDASPG